jgi:hypothetical protein
MPSPLNKRVILPLLLIAFGFVLILGVLLWQVIVAPSQTNPQGNFHTFPNSSVYEFSDYSSSKNTAFMINRDYPYQQIEKTQAVDLRFYNI